MDAPMMTSRIPTSSSQQPADGCLRSYVDQVRQRASNTQSIFPGPHLDNLAAYLERGLDKLLHSLNVESGEPFQTEAPHFLYLCDLKKPVSERVQEFRSPKEFWNVTREQSYHTEQSKVLFLRGHPSPEWLVAIGSRYDIDYSFFGKHLHFRSAVGKPDYFGQPTLPSNACIPQLKVTTIGGLTRESSQAASQASLDTLRMKNQKNMQEYMEGLRLERNVVTGESIVREFSTHDESHFSLEQDISIFVKESHSGWIALVWMDHGSLLGSQPKTAWLTKPLQSPTWKISYFPTIHYGNFRTVNANHGGQELSELTPQKGQSPLFQSATFLPEYFSSHVDAEVAAEDAFFAVAKIFEFAATTESQVLNLIESKVAKEANPIMLLNKNDLSLTNLLYNKQFLERHIDRIQENHRMIASSSDINWPRSVRATTDGEMQKAISRSKASLLDDYDYLLERARSLSRMCETNMQIVIQSLQVRETTEQIKEARSVTSVTRLAFVFVPLSFVASVFGINAKQFGQGDISIWVFFATALPVFAMSIATLLFMPRLATAWKKRVKHRKGKNN